MSVLKEGERLRVIKSRWGGNEGNKSIVRMCALCKFQNGQRKDSGRYQL